MRTITISVEEFDGETITRCDKRISETEYKRFAWSTWAEILYLTVQDLENKLERELERRQ